MKKLLSIHQYILLAALLVIALQVLFYIFLLRPRIAEHVRAHKELDRMQQRLAKSHWPQSAEKLKQLLDEHRVLLKGDQQKPGIEKQTAQLLAQASRMYDTRIREFYGNKVDFYRNVSRLDFQEEFNRLQMRLQSLGIALQPSALNLTEDTMSAYNYQLMLQLWTLEKICTLFHAAGLQAKNLPSGREKSPAGQISLRPIQAFFREEKAERPFLLEIPVVLTLSGTLEQFLLYCASLQSDDVFLGVKEFSLIALPPGSPAADEKGFLKNEPLRLKLVCAGYYHY